MIDRRRPWRDLLVILALASLAAGGQEVRFRTILVLPAQNQTDSRRLAAYGPAWQYLLQERLRLLPGIAVPRLSDRPEAMAQARDRQFDPNDPTARDAVAAAYGADLIVLPQMVAEPPEWELAARLFVPGTPAPTAEVPSAKGADPAVIGDAVLNEVLRLGEVTTLQLAANPDRNVREEDFRTLASWLYRWPFSAPEHADLPKENAAKELAAAITQAGAGRSQFSLLVQHAVNCYVAAGEAPAAQRAAQQYCARRSRDARARLIWGNSFAGADDVEAIKHYTEAANLTRGSVQAVEALAAAYLRRGDTAQALAQYDSAVRLWPRVVPLQLKRGQMALEARDWDSAVRAFQAAAAATPPPPEALAGLAQAQLAAGQPAEALAAANQLLALRPDDHAALLLVAEAAVGAGQFAPAREAAEKAVAQAGDDAKAHRLLGLACLGLQDYAAAEPALARSLELDPSYVAGYLSLADVRSMAGNLEGAAAALAAGIGKAEGVEKARLQLAAARIEYYREQYDAALAQLSEARTLLPDDVPSFYLEGQIQLYRGEWLAAAAAIGAAAERDPGLAGPGAGVLAEFEAAAAESDTPETTFGLAVLYQAAGKSREARNCYRDFLLTKPADDVAAWCNEQIAALGR